MLRIYFLWIFLLSLAACGSSDVESVSNVEENGDKVTYSRKKTDYAKQGKYIRHNAQGQLLEEANYANDTLHGPRTLYFSNGKPEIVETYEMGQFVGPYLLYFENGQLQQEGEYIGGQMEGAWKTFYETGELKEVVHFTNSEENGPFIEYYKNGQIKAEGEYLNGDNEHGLLELYDESGQLTKKMECNKGICRTIWTLEETPQQDG
ncbi:MAG: toxin-antitoxin system YwqK family antitoxin [Bacteroidota bacterium]